MKSKSNRAGKWIAVFGLLASCVSSQAATLTFASFSDTTANNWVYTGGSLSAVNDTALFTSFGSPNHILNYTGPVTYSVTATAAGAAAFDGTFIKQAMNGHIQYKSGTTTVLGHCLPRGSHHWDPGQQFHIVPCRHHHRRHRDQL